MRERETYLELGNLVLAEPQLLETDQGVKVLDLLQMGISNLSNIVVHMTRAHPDAVAAELEGTE